MVSTPTRPSASVDLARYALPGLRGLLVYTGLGILSTVVMQSSHATLMLTITALAAGQVTYDNALALAVGSNVGTTVTALLGAISANIAGRRLAALVLVDQHKARHPSDHLLVETLGDDLLHRPVLLDIALQHLVQHFVGGQ